MVHSAQVTETNDLSVLFSGGQLHPAHPPRPSGARHFLRAPLAADDAIICNVWTRGNVLASLPYSYAHVNGHVCVYVCVYAHMCVLMFSGQLL